MTTTTGTSTIKIPQGEIITIELPGLTAIRIDTVGRFIAIDGISGGGGPGTRPLLPRFIIHDLQEDGIYGGFHRLRPADECFGPRGCAHTDDCDDDPECGGCGQHIQGAYTHKHDTIEGVATCEECIGRAAELRILADV